MDLIRNVNDVQQLAKALTGWTYGNPSGTPPSVKARLAGSALACAFMVNARRQAKGLTGLRMAVGSLRTDDEGQRARDFARGVDDAGARAALRIGETADGAFLVAALAVLVVPAFADDFTLKSLRIESHGYGFQAEVLVKKAEQIGAAG